MKDFIYPVSKIFDIDDVPTNYYIGTYQRGYKWGSLSRFDKVPQLLIDIYSASAGEEDYYLQYITIKYVSQQQYYEVIDGQQRLTSLSLIFYLLEHYGKENIAKGRVNYSRYGEGNIFENTLKYILDNDETNDEEIAEQDFYYFVKAARVIKRFLDFCDDAGTLDRFVDFLLDKVMIIVNTECEFIVPEEVFMNLNNNRVPLTDSYLIKGLLLTLAVKRKSADGRHLGYKEIMDQRAVMGRQWDEINAWISSPKVSHYFFGDKQKGLDGIMEMALELIAKNPQFKVEVSHSSEADEVLDAFVATLNGGKASNKGMFELFNKYNELIKTRMEAFKALEIIKHIYHRLHDIYENHEDSRLYNLLGYVLFCERVNKKLIDFKLIEIIDCKLDETLQKLSQLAHSAIPDMEKIKSEATGEYKYPSLRYKSHNPFLTNLLLSFNVFPEHGDKKYRFDFYQYSENNWSFEHISPQHPKKKVRIAKSAARNVKDLIAKRFDIDEEQRGELIRKIDNNEPIEAEESSVLYDEQIDLDALGNMALLDGAANSALNNNPYMAKRDILFDLTSRGYFIPRHTMDVFNKVLDTSDNEEHHFSSNLLEWTDDKDVKAHEEWMLRRNKAIRSMLNS